MISICQLKRLLSTFLPSRPQLITVEILQAKTAEDRKPTAVKEIDFDSCGFYTNTEKLDTAAYLIQCILIEESVSSVQMRTLEA